MSNYKILLFEGKASSLQRNLILESADLKIWGSAAVQGWEAGPQGQTESGKGPRCRADPVSGHGVGGHHRSPPPPGPGARGPGVPQGGQMPGSP